MFAIIRADFAIYTTDIYPFKYIIRTFIYIGINRLLLYICVGQETKSLD